MEFAALGALYYQDKPEYFEECLKSLSNQTKKIPIYIVIDGPIGHELETIITKYNNLEITYFKLNTNSGLARALDHSVKRLRDKVDYIIRFDSDDINHSNRFEILINFIEQKKPDLVSSHMNEINEDSKLFSKKLVPTSQKQIKRIFPYRNPINHPASAFNIEAILSVGGYKEMPFFEDYYLWARMHKSGFKIMNIDNFLVDFRATDMMIKRRYGLSYLKHEIYFIWKRNLEGIFNPLENILSFLIRFTSKIFGLKIYKLIYFSLRKKIN